MIIDMPKSRLREEIEFLGGYFVILLLFCLSFGLTHLLFSDMISIIYDEAYSMQKGLSMASGGAISERDIALIVDEETGARYLAVDGEGITRLPQGDQIEEESDEGLKEN